jgi:hypothetical protein
MKNKRIFWFSILILLSVGLVFSTVSAPIVQAREVEAGLFEEVSAPVKEATPVQAAYSPAAYAEVWGITPDMLVNCDPAGTLLTSTNPGSRMTYHKLQAGACRQQAVLDEQAAAQQKQAQLAAQGSCSGSGGVAGHSCGFSGVSGEGNQLKIYGITTDVRYVYLQCGKKVSEIGPPTCSCGSGYYTYTCKRPPTVYITIPCYH